MKAWKPTEPARLVRWLLYLPTLEHSKNSDVSCRFYPTGGRGSARGITLCFGGLEGARSSQEFASSWIQASRTLRQVSILAKRKRMFTRKRHSGLWRPRGRRRCLWCLGSNGIGRCPIRHIPYYLECKSPPLARGLSAVLMEGTNAPYSLLFSCISCPSCYPV